MPRIFFVGCCSGFQLSAPPLVLSATPGNAQVALSWTPALGASSYILKRATVSGGPYTTVYSPIGTSQLDTGVVNGTTYYYIVIAVINGINSAPSNEASARPTASAYTAFNTGEAFTGSVGTNAVDSHWTMTTPSQSAYVVPTSGFWFDPSGGGATPVKWLSASVDGLATDSTPTVYNYRTTLHIAGGVTISLLNISALIACDNHVTDIKVNGVSITAALGGISFFGFTTITFDDSLFVTGDNTIDVFTINNDIISGFALAWLH